MLKEEVDVCHIQKIHMGKEVCPHVEEKEVVGVMLVVVVIVC